MKATIAGNGVSVDFAVGDHLLFDCTVQLPRVDADGAIVTEPVTKTMKVDKELDTTKTVLEHRVVFESVKLKAGSISTTGAKDPAEARQRRCVPWCTVLLQACE